jgi:Dictyostelium (slime mold) repeat
MPARSTASRIALVTGVLCATLLPGRALAFHQEAPAVIRLTRGESHAHPPTHSWGTYFAFSSSEDLTDLGAARAPGKQVFVFSLARYVCQRGTPLPGTCTGADEPFLVQVTNNPGEPENPSVADVDDEMNQWVAFDALGTFDGATGSVATHRQVYLKNVATGEQRRLTNGADGDSVRPSVSSLAGIVAFESSAALAGTSSAVSQIFVYERDADLLRQITSGAGPSTLASPNRAGQLVTFESTAALLSDGHDTGTAQIFWSEYDRTLHQSTLRQLTAGDAPSRHPYFGERQTGQGRKAFIAFDSEATDLPGTPNGPGTQVYVSSFVDDPAAPDPTLERLTDGTHGDCSRPAVNPSGDHVLFVCTGDAQEQTQFGDRAYYWDEGSDTIIRVESSFDLQGPIAANLGQWFLTASAPSERMGTGGCGYQLHVVDYFLNQPTTGSNVIGLRNFQLQPGAGPTGSQVLLTTTAGTTSAPLTGEGRIGLDVAAPDVFTGEAAIRVPATAVRIPPVPISGVGTLCAAATADGTGVIDCNGAATGGDLLIAQDHTTDDVDPTCSLGCREDDVACGTSALPGPHRTQCPVCFLGHCAGGIFDGASCLTDDACRPGMTCEDDTAAVCNGPVFTELDEPADAGVTRLTIPLSLRLSLNSGTDGLTCTDDDLYSPTLLPQAPFTLSLTTGIVTGAILDAEAVAGTTLAVPRLGRPATCNRLRAGELTGTQLVGAVPLLDVPRAPGVHDLILTLVLEAADDGDADCRPPCAADADCSDGDLCNGVETCDTGSGLCQAGTLVSCGDGNACNGFETCDPATGECRAGTPAVCDDGDPCNGAETCQPATGACLPGMPIACSDGNLCNGVETCDPSNGTCTPGTPVVCGDLDPCDGAEVCNPASGACEAGPPPDCDDGNPCTADACVPGVGCTTSERSGSCDDGNLCTTGDACAAGTCTGTPLACADDGDVCNGTQVCDPSTGTCGPIPAPSCDDGNPCTADACDPTAGCTHANAAAPCDDGDACTADDTCRDGACTGTAVACDDGDACNGVETCDPATGLCRAGPAPVCDDGSSCTIDTCDPALGCVGTPVDDPLICQFIEIDAALNDLLERTRRTAPQALGGKSARRRLARLLRSARTKLRKAGGGSSGRVRRGLKRVEQRLDAYAKRIERGMRRLRVDPQVGTALRRAALSTVARLAGVRSDLGATEDTEPTRAMARVGVGGREFGGGGWGGGRAAARGAGAAELVSGSACASSCLCSGSGWRSTGRRSPGGCLCLVRRARPPASSCRAPLAGRRPTCAVSGGPT